MVMRTQVIENTLTDIYDVLIEIRKLLENINGHNSTGRGGLSDKQVEKGSIPLCPTTHYIAENSDLWIDDGFGSSWSIFCAMCHKPTMQVVRPGKAQCGTCG